jgi:ribosomal protection tetracycline resistance protein
LRTLNLGIVAHVDAGKTSLTERLLYATGVIDQLGSVDDGSTRTDTSALERRRGITINAAVVSFVLDGTTVNLIDTPGHPDFIAEVERAGAVLVVSAVEGVQSQTRILFHVLQRMRLPTLIFVNKIDRPGARRPMRDLEKLTPDVVAMGTVRGLGTRAAEFVSHGPATSGSLVEFLAEHDDTLLTAFVDGTPVPYDRLESALADRSRRALAHPVFFGSAITGAGADALLAGLTDLLPTADGDVDGPVWGTVFKIERGPAGDKVAYVRMFSGTVRVRDRLWIGGQENQVTGLAVFGGGPPVRRAAVVAGQIGLLRGLDDARIGDGIGEPRTAPGERRFTRRRWRPSSSRAARAIGVRCTRP